MSEDPWKDPDTVAWMDHVRREVAPAMQGSAYVMSLVPSGEVDVKFAVELGLAIMMDKPIIAVAHHGSKPPAKLVQVTDKIIEADFSTKEGTRDAARRTKQAMEEIANEQGPEQES